MMSERLEYRPVAAATLDDFHRLVQDDHVRRYLMDGELLPREWSEQRVRDSADLFERCGVGLWLAHQRETGDVVGFCGFLTYRRYIRNRSSCTQCSNDSLARDMPQRWPARRSPRLAAILVSARSSPALMRRTSRRSASWRSLGSGKPRGIQAPSAMCSCWRSSVNNMQASDDTNRQSVACVTSITIASARLGGEVPNGKWSDDAFLDALRRQGDPQADAAVARLIADGGNPGGRPDLQDASKPTTRRSPRMRRHHSRTSWRPRLACPRTSTEPA